MSRPFLTDLDSRAAVKGSRDPLGLVPLWSHFGRFVVGNLTTVTTSVRGFTTLLLGYHFAREVQDRVGREAESTLALFLKFEQLAAHCRYFVKDGEFRGVERVKKNLSETSNIHLSVEPRDQILSNAKVYGLWGLYSSPARTSGLLERDEPVLTPAAREFVEKQYLAFLTKEGLKEGREIVELLRQRRSEVRLDNGHNRLARAVARLLSSRYSSAEREFYSSHLVLGGKDDPTGGRQSHLAGLLASLPSEQFDRGDLRELMRQSKRRGKDWELLADRLSRIDILESVLVPADSLFGFALARQAQTLAKVTDEVGKAWKKGLKFIDIEAVRTIEADMAAGLRSSEAGGRWVRIAESLSSGDYASALRLLLEHNAFVMHSRNGSPPWIRVASGRLDIRFREASGGLRPVSEMADAWVNTYFLNSLKSVVHTLAEA